MKEMIRYVRLRDEKSYGRVITMAYRKSYSRADELEILAEVIRKTLPVGQGLSAR